MPRPLVAKHHRADGELVVRLDVPHFLTRDDAARALALVYPDQAVLTGEREFRSGLSRAVRERVLEQPGVEPDEALVAAYLPVVDRHWPDHARYDEDGAWVGAGDERAVQARFEVQTFFSREETARALALVHGEMPMRVGPMTIDQGLHKAARERVLSREFGEAPDEALVDRFRALLVAFGPWTTGK